MEAIILAGGYGTRLASRIQNLPKPMAPINGRPFLEYLFHNLAGAHYDHVILSVGYLYEKIAEHFGSEFNGISVDYVIEEMPLGTGGAIKRALSAVSNHCVLVLNGDTFLDFDYAAFAAYHNNAKSNFSLVASRQNDVSRYGGVCIKNHYVTGFVEKGKSGSGWINAGAYMINKNFVWPAHLPEKFSFESEVLMPCFRDINPLAFCSDGFFLDIGVPADYDRAQIELRRFIE